MLVLSHHLHSHKLVSLSPCRSANGRRTAPSGSAPRLAPPRWCCASPCCALSDSRPQVSAGGSVRAEDSTVALSRIALLRARWTVLDKSHGRRLEPRHLDVESDVERKRKSQVSPVVECAQVRVSWTKTEPAGARICISPGMGAVTVMPSCGERGLRGSRCDCGTTVANPDRETSAVPRKK